MKVFLKAIKFLIKFALVFMIFFIWLGYALPSRLQAALISLPCAALLTSILNFFAKNKESALLLKNKEAQEANAMFDSLIQNKDYDFFCRLAKTRHKDVTKKRICTVIDNKESKILIYPYLKIKPLDKDNALSISLCASKQKVAKVVVCAQTIENGVEAFCKNLPVDIVLLDQYQCYQYLFKEYDFFPQPSATKISSESKFKQMLGHAFNRSRSKGYALSALLLLVISFFLQQSLYYCIVATLLLIFALISIKPRSSAQKAKNII